MPALNLSGMLTFYAYLRSTAADSLRRLKPCKSPDASPIFTVAASAAHSILHIGTSFHNINKCILLSSSAMHFIHQFNSRSPLLRSLCRIGNE